MGSNAPRKLDISYPTNEFTKLVKMWDKYDPDTMGVIVRYIKSYVIRSPPPSLVGGVSFEKLCSERD